MKWTIVGCIAAFGIFVTALPLVCGTRLFSQPPPLPPLPENITWTGNMLVVTQYFPIVEATIKDGIVFTNRVHTNTTTDAYEIGIRPGGILVVRKK